MNARDRVGELATERGLGEGAAPRLWALLELLAADPHAPSAVRDPARAAEVHLADSLSALELPPVRDAQRVTDIGSGAGFPGLPLAIALGEASVVLIEASGRKCEFIERARSAAAIGNARVVCSRAEEWGEGHGWADLVTARALGELALVLEYAAPLLALGGTVVAWKGAVSARELDAGMRAAPELGLEPRGVVRSSPYPGSASHHLHVYAKTTDTPARFPRRPGAAAKQPLGRER